MVPLMEILFFTSKRIFKAVTVIGIDTLTVTATTECTCLISEVPFSFVHDQRVLLKNVT